MPDNKQLRSITQISEILDIELSLLCHWTKQPGAPESEIIGNRRFFDEEAMIAWWPLRCWIKSKLQPRKNIRPKNPTAGAVNEKK
jgi:hypothetical protein